MFCRRKFLKTVALGLVVVFVGLCGEAVAQRRPDRRREGPQWDDHRRDRGHPYRRGHFVKAPPRGHKEVVIRGSRYYYGGGVYYRRGPRGYVVVGPPVGAFVVSLPPAYVRIHVGPGLYYYHYGAFYRHYPNRHGYVVVRAPLGAVVPVLPVGYATVIVHGQTYYVVDDVYYHATYLYGDRRYVVVKVGFWGPLEERLSDRDQYLLSQNVQTALENAPSGQTSVWQNPDSRNSGTITPEPARKNEVGQDCRGFEQSITIEGQTQRARGTACRQPDGTWQILP